MTKDVNGGMNRIYDSSNELLIMQQIVLGRTCQNRPAISPREDCVAIFGKVSAQPHTVVKQICFPNGNVLFLSLFSLFKN